MITVRSDKGLFTSNDLSKVVGLDGRALSGVLSSFAKREGQPLIIRAGTIDVSWDGEPFKRPKQLWMMNPRLSEKELSEIKESLIELLSTEMWCPWCGYVSTNNWEGYAATLDEPRPKCPACGGAAVMEKKQKEHYGQR